MTGLAPKIDNIIEDIPSKLILSIGKATYRETALSGRDKFDTWKKDFMNFLQTYTIY